MNRVLKFRIWSEKDGEFIDPTRFGIGYDGELTNMWDGISPDPMLGFTIQQFTGLKDKNGKEVYEGDLIEVDGWTKYLKKADIKFKYGCFTLNSLPMTQYSQTELIIVGNIFEKPELLA